MVAFETVSGDAQNGIVGRRASWAALAAIFLIGSALRIVHLDSDFWIDEVATLATYLRLPFGEMVRTYKSANQHLLYSVLGGLSIRVFGESEWAARLPAVLFGIAGIWALHSTARRFAGERESLWAPAFLALSYHHIWFSQNARGYSAMVFCAIVSTSLFERAVRENRVALWAGYVLVMTAAICAVLNSVFVLLGHIAAVIVLQSGARRDPGRRIRPMLLAAGCAASSSLICHSLMLPRMIDWFRNEDRTGLGFGLSALAPVLTNGLVLGLGLAGVVGAAACLAAGWISYWRRTPLIALLLILPGVLNAIVLVVLGMGAYPRSFLYALPFGILVATRGLCLAAERIFRPAWVQQTVLAIALVVTAIPLIRYYRFPKQDFRGALRYVEQHKTEGDAVAAVGLAGVCYREYYAPALPVPASIEELAALGRPGRTAWVLYSYPRDMRLRFPEIDEYLRRHFHPAAVFPGTLSDGDLYVVKSRMLE